MGFLLHWKPIAFFHPLFQGNPHVASSNGDLQKLHIKLHPRGARLVLYGARIGSSGKDLVSPNRGHYITNPNKALLRENPSKLPYICIKFESPQDGVI